MAAQNQTRGIAADGAMSIFAETGASARPPDGRQAAKQTMLTCTWVTADDGALVMQWTSVVPCTAQEPGDEHGETTKAAA